MTISSKKLAKESTGSGTVHRVLKLMVILADAEKPLTIQYAAEKIDLAPSTTHRLMNLLKDEGFVTYQPDTRTYSIGPRYHRVAARVHAGMNVVGLAEQLIADLAHKYDETILFGLYLPEDQAMSFLARADGKQRLTYRIEMNKPLSLVWGASGKTILAYLPVSEVEAVLKKEGVSPASGQKPPKFQELLETLENVRKDGYLVSAGEKLPGSCGIAAPVFDAGRVIGSVCLTSPQDRLSDRDLIAIGKDVTNCANQLSYRLGAT